MNRSALEEKLNELVIAAEKEVAPRALLTVRVDRSELVSEAIGRAVVDEQFRQVAGVLTDQRSERITPARLNESSFAAVCEGYNEKDSQALATRLLESIRALNFSWGDTDIPLTASIGIASFSIPGANAGSVIQQAEIACECAMTQGGDRSYVYQASDDPVTLRRNDLE